MSPPVVGIKFCGGCKEQYDRIKAWTQLKENCPEAEFVPVSKGTVYELILVISGCYSQCPNLTGLESRQGFVRLCIPEQFPEAVRKINGLTKTL